MAVAAGVRAEICTMPVPSLIFEVWLPHHASGVNASEPYASAVHIDSKPRRSASATCSCTPGGGPALFQYPMTSPSFMTWCSSAELERVLVWADGHAHRRRCDRPHDGAP